MTNIFSKNLFYPKIFNTFAQQLLLLACYLNKQQ
jgi:hypothetical protein